MVMISQYYADYLKELCLGLKLEKVTRQQKPLLVYSLIRILILDGY